MIKVVLQVISSYIVSSFKFLPNFIVEIPQMSDELWWRNSLNKSNMHRLNLKVLSLQHHDNPVMYIADPLTLKQMVGITLFSTLPSSQVNVQKFSRFSQLNTQRRILLCGSFFFCVSPCFLVRINIGFCPREEEHRAFQEWWLFLSQAHSHASQETLT